MGRGDRVAWTGSVLSEAWEALGGEAASRNPGDSEKGDEVSFLTAKAATADGVGDDRGEGDVAPRLKASRAISKDDTLLGLPIVAVGFEPALPRRHCC